MKLLTREQAQELDRISIEEFGISGIDLMGRAGCAVAKHAIKIVEDVRDPKIAIVCGKGNNAGDGYKSAIELSKNNLDVQLFVVPSLNEIIGDSRHFYDLCMLENISINHTTEPPIGKFDLIIDALLGTGFSGELRAPISEIVKWLNSQSGKILSIDIPTGVDANYGKISKISVEADVTITIGMPKVGMTLEPGKSHCGKIITEEIGFPEIYQDLNGIKFNLIDEELAQRYLTAPPVDTYKHQQGKVLIIAGSRGMTGAAILAANAAIRSGAGLVTCCVPKSLNGIYESNIIEGLTIICEDNGDGIFKLQNFTEIEEHFKWADSILIGPGLGKNHSTVQLVEKVITNFAKPIIIDADGLNCFTDNKKLFKNIKGDFIITPHLGELARLMGVQKSDLKEKYFELLSHYLIDFNGTLVAKNAPTITFTNNKAVINSSGNQGLASGGTGDVLSGIIASFLAQGIPSHIAAELGVFMHGKAADMIFDKTGYRGLIASDIITALPQTIKQYE